MCFTSHKRSAGFFHGHLPSTGHSAGVHHRRLDRVGRTGLDPGHFPGASLRLHVDDARNSIVAAGQEPRGRGQGGAPVPEGEVTGLVKSLFYRGMKVTDAGFGFDGSHTDITNEFERLKVAVKKTTGADNRMHPKELLKGSVLKPLLVSMGLMLLQQFCGINSIIYFTVAIFDKAGSSIDKNLSTIIVGIVQLLATISSMFLVDRAGRRILLFVSGFGMAVALAALGSFFYLLEIYGEEVQDSLGWLPLASLLLFIMAYSCGYANVPFLIMGEIFPTKFR